MSHTAGSQAALQLHARRSTSVHTVHRIAAWIAAHSRRRRDTNHVRELPDYLLKDIGLAHRDIDSAFRSDPRKSKVRAV
ncbi:MAG: DUF1127 domain-containing protein [Hyphomicrobiales bacterium]|nr:DUF1127 domain-containing protein [Hyphomicrobiales bacterium]MCP4997221.1 DUF1127 domain-containing protein [Hyphomicrobiales bacterium]